MKVLCIGESLLEITCPINDTINEGKNLILDEKIECGGGHAGNVAYLLGKWGVESYIASMLGADDSATKIKKEYETIGVKTDYLETSYDKQTNESIILINKNNKIDTVLNINSNSHLKKYSFGLEPDIIVTDGNDFNATVAACDKFPNATSYLLVSKNTKEVMELGRYVKNIILKKETAEEMAQLKIDFNNSSTIVNVYNKLKQKYNNAEIIITLGEMGSVYSINSQVKIMPVVKNEIVDTNGAGDVFAGAFIYAMGRSFGLEKSIAYATIAASFSITKLTSRMSIPTLTEVSTYYDNKFGAENNPNNQNNQNVETEEQLQTKNDVLMGNSEVKNDNTQNS